VLIFVCVVLARGRVNVARLLLDMLPPELAAISTPEERAAEYLDYRQFFIAWETLERVTECQALEAPQVSRNTHAAWLKDYGVRALLFSSPPGFLK
jgi:nuclear pore complex protein Nup107